METRGGKRYLKNNLDLFQDPGSYRRGSSSHGKEGYEGSFAMMDPRRYGVHKTPSEEEEYEEDMD